MPRTALWCLFWGSVLGGTLVHLRRSPPAAPMPLRFAVRVDRTLPPPPPPPVPPPPSPHAVACGDPERIGAPLATRPADNTAPRWWRVAAAAKACVIVAWSKADLVASWDDGATFAPVLASRAEIVGADVGDDGTIYVVRADFTLAIAHPDGRTITRRLVFRGEPLARGRWLVIRGTYVPETTLAISDDDGGSWRQLEPPYGAVTDLHVLADGAIVAHTDWHGELCDHFGCGSGPIEGDVESRLDDGRKWQTATRAHVRAAGVTAPHTRDPHGFELEVMAGRQIVRSGERGMRVLYTGAP